MNKFGLQFEGKLIIQGKITCITGLHIGASDQPYEIGGMDNPVIRDPLTDMPYIPGSSLKGKIRSLLEWSHKHEDGQTCVDWSLKEGKGQKCEPCKCGECDVCIVFGTSVDREAGKSSEPEKGKEGFNGPTRLTVRDAFLPEDLREGDIEVEEVEKMIEVKAENAIDRLTSAANPRTMERVSAGTEFVFDMIFDIYHEEDKQERIGLLFNGLRLLEDSSLGGGGTRGSGHVKLGITSIVYRDWNYYMKNGQEKHVVDALRSIDDVLKLDWTKELGGAEAPVQSAGTGYHENI